jgi:ABC-2 type transport system permease protein
VSARRKIAEVARRELAERWRSRAMRVSYALLLVLVVAGAVALSLADESKPTDDFGVAGPPAAALAPALRAAAQADGREARVHRLRDRAAAERSLRTGAVDVAIVDGRLLVEESRSEPAVAAARRALAAQTTLARLQAAGLTRQQALEALAAPAPRVDVLDAGARDRERDNGMLQIGVLILFFSLIVAGQAVAASVTEEKSSRVIELLLTTVPPRRLLAGKVVGVGALGLAQVATVCAAGLAAAELAGGDGLPPSATEMVALIVGWFVLGYAFYSVAYAALGALVSRQEDLEATTAPVNVLLLAAYFGANAAIQDPDGTWAQIAAFLPPLSPMVVPTRVVLGDMGALGLVAAVAVELVAIALTIRVAAAIYERSILRTGAPISLRSALPLHVPAALIQAGAVAALLGGVVVGADRPAGIALFAAGLLLVAAYRHGRRPPTPQG